VEERAMKLTFDVPEGLAEKIGEEIKAALEEYRKKQVWPQTGDTYYCVYGDGDIGFSTFDDMYETDCDRRSFGNVFKTKKEAEFKKEQLKVFHELEQLADNDQPWDNTQLHYAIYYDNKRDIIMFECWFNNQYLPNTYYFKSRESVQAAINKIGKDRLKKYYFCIPEDE
jgi:hypothetical protein